MVVLGDTQKEVEVAHFQAPAIQHNPDGWGPCELPDQFKDIPYQPFSKGDRLGKVSTHERHNRSVIYFDAENVLIRFFVSRRSLTGLRHPSRIRSFQVNIMLF